VNDQARRVHQPTIYEQLDPVPVTPPGEEVLRLRDTLRDQFAGLGFEVRVQLTTYGLGRRMVIDPLSLDETRTLVRVLHSKPETGERLRKGAAVWCEDRGMVGEVLVPGRKRVLLHSLARHTEWWSEPVLLRPATLVEIDAARDAAERLVPGDGGWL
jgi:hypothetical protein